MLRASVFVLLRASVAGFRDRLLTERRDKFRRAHGVAPRWQRTFRPPPVQALRFVRARSASFARAAQPSGFRGKIRQAASRG